jgi:ketosteroid isomerase-like protein
MKAEQEQAGDEARIRALLSERIAAFRARDASRFVTSLDPSIVTFDLAPPLRSAGPELLDPSGFQAWLDTWDGEIGYEMAELTISIGGDIAYCHSLDHLTGTRTDGEREDFWVRSTVGLRKTGDGWKVTHEHTSVPFSTWMAPAGPRSTCGRKRILPFAAGALRIHESPGRRGWITSSTQHYPCSAYSRLSRVSRGRPRPPD